MFRNPRKEVNWSWWGTLRPICTVLAPLRIGLAPIKPCTLIFPMGFGALIQISLSTNSTSSISGSRTKKQSHCKLFLGGEPFQSIDSTQGMMALHPAKHLCRKYLLFPAPNPLKTSETNCLGRKYLAHWSHKMHRLFFDGPLLMPKFLCVKMSRRYKVD